MPKESYINNKQSYGKISQRVSVERDEIPGKVGDGYLSAVIAEFQATEEHRLLRVPNLPAEHSHRDALVGQLLD